MSDTKVDISLNERELLTVAEAAARAGMAERSFRTLVLNVHVMPWRIEGFADARVHRETLDAWIAAQQRACERPTVHSLSARRSKAQ